MVDALASGASVLTGVEVRVFSWAPSKTQLQRNAQSATGQLEALQYANQFHSAQAHQLLQLRNMINTEMQANAAYRQAQLDKEAQGAAAKLFMGYGKYLDQPTGNSMKPTFLFFSILFVLSGCSQEPERDVQWYVSHPEEHNKQLDSCENNPAKLANTSNCINAKKAAGEKAMGFGKFKPRSK